MDLKRFMASFVSSAWVMSLSSVYTPSTSKPLSMLWDNHVKSSSSFTTFKWFEVITDKLFLSISFCLVLGKHCELGERSDYARDVRSRGKRQGVVNGQADSRQDKLALAGGSDNVVLISGLLVSIEG